MFESLTFRSFLVGLAFILAVDAIWLSWAVDRIYRPGMGSIARPAFDGNKMAIGALSWPILVVGLAVLVLGRAQTSSEAFKLGCVAGFVTYSVYNLTNLATLREWNMPMPLVDIVWGTLLSGATAHVMFRYS